MASASSNKQQAQPFSDNKQKVLKEKKKKKSKLSKIQTNHIIINREPTFEISAGIAASVEVLR